MSTTQESKREPTRSLENIKNLFQTDNSADEEKIKKYESLIDKIVKIPIEDIELDENIRSSIDTNDESFKSLLHSIKRHGIQQNIVVEFRKLANGFKIVCVSGHRRVSAARMAGISVVPAVIKHFDKVDTRVELALAENLLREGLHCLDIANGYQKLFDFGWTKEKLMESFGKTHRTISTYLKMATWPEKAKNIIRANPNIFTTRFLVHQIACKKFNSDDEIISCLNNFINTDKNQPNKTSRKQANRQKLTEYLSTKNYSEPINHAIEQTFKDLQFLD
jgi:ParB family chromosome partitioning protein